MVRQLGKMRHDIRREQFVSLDVVPVIAIDQKLHAGVLILADQIDGRRYGTNKTPQGSASGQPLTFRLHSGLVTGN